MPRVMTVGELREALAGPPEWRPVALGIETEWSCSCSCCWPASSR